jgi:hypothetical protein
MAVITKGPIVKGSGGLITLDKTELVSLVSDPYYQDLSNWKTVALLFKSSTGNQKIPVTFDATKASPTADFITSLKANDIFEINHIRILDFDKGSIVIPRSALTVGDFDIDLSLPSPLIEQLSKSTSYQGITSPVVAAGQSFQPVSNIQVSSIEVGGMKDEEDVSTRVLLCRILEENGTLIATSEQLDKSGLILNEAVWMPFNFTSPVALLANTTYRFEVYTTGGTGQISVTGANFNSNPYAGGYYYSGANYGTPSANDLGFRILGS